jgi:pyruvate formate lyase activating enzyme
MFIKGLQKTSLIDYPPYVVSTIFLGGCNFRCPYCHNPDLINSLEEYPDISTEDLLDFLKVRKKWIDGVCITGGEPTIHEKLPELISKIKDIGFLVKLDTNGTNPKMLKELFKKKLLDYVAMDIKAPLEKYDNACGVKPEKKDIVESVKLIRNSGVDYEFRTTIVPKFFDEKDARLIGEWLKGSRRYYLQQFRPDSVLDKTFEKVKPYSKTDLLRLREILAPFFELCDIRGIEKNLKVDGSKT